EPQLVGLSVAVQVGALAGGGAVGDLVIGGRAAVAGGTRLPGGRLAGAGPGPLGRARAGALVTPGALGGRCSGTGRAGGRLLSPATSRQAERGDQGQGGADGARSGHGDLSSAVRALPPALLRCVSLCSPTYWSSTRARSTHPRRPSAPEHGELRRRDTATHEELRRRHSAVPARAARP